MVEIARSLPTEAAGLTIPMREDSVQASPAVHDWATKTGCAALVCEFARFFARRRDEVKFLRFFLTPPTAAMLAWVIPPTGTIAMQPSSPSAAYPVSEPRVRVHPPFFTTNISNWKGLKKSSHLGNQALFPREETTRARACRGPRGRGEKGWSGVAGRETMELVDFEWRFGGESNHETEFKHHTGQARGASFV